MNLSLRPFSLQTLTALAAGDGSTASAQFGVTIPAELLTQPWVWEHYAGLLAARADVEGWITEAVLDNGEVIGYAGFHEPPDDDGMVELGYTILTPFRRRGVATEVVAILVDLAESRGVTTLSGFVSPDNEPSIKVLRSNGFWFVREVESKRGPQHMYARRLADD